MEPSALTSAFQSVATSITNGIGEVAPIAITVMGTILIWRVGARFFKTLAK